MKGHVPTPDPLADHMVEKLFDSMPPEEGDRILYPGLGTGPFVAAVERYCEEHDLPVPGGLGVEQDPELAEESRKLHKDRNVEIVEANFLTTNDYGEFRFVLGNPPYVPIEGLDEQEKSAYRKRFDTAIERFDLYLLFFEKSLDLLAENGRLTFVTPEKFTYVSTGSELRELLTQQFHVKELEHVDADSFEGLITYPLITTIDHEEPNGTQVVMRDGAERDVELPSDGTSWAATLRGGAPDIETGVTLEDVTKRVSCGVATGRDSLFVVDEENVPPELVGWTYPTTSGRQLKENDGPDSGQVFICPYDDNGNLVPDDELGEYGKWAEQHREELESRSCVEKGKAWYSYHENPPMKDLYGVPKLLSKDVTDEVHFWKDESGDVIPRHSVYYIIPDDGVDIDELQEWMNSGDAAAWLEAHSQRAHNNFLRMQSTVLKQLPVPTELGDHHQATLPGLE